MYTVNMQGCKPSYYNNYQDALKTYNYIWFKVTHNVSIRKISVNTLNKNIYLGRI